MGWLQDDRGGGTGRRARARHVGGHNANLDVLTPIRGDQPIFRRRCATDGDIRARGRCRSQPLVGKCDRGTTRG